MELHFGFCATSTRKQERGRVGLLQPLAWAELTLYLNIRETAPS